MRDTTHYFLEVTYGTAFKNGLQKQVFETLKEHDRELFESSDLNNIKQRVLDVVNGLATEHPRCKPLKASWNDGFTYTPNDHWLSLNGETFMYVKIKALWS